MSTFALSRITRGLAFIGLLTVSGEVFGQTPAPYPRGTAFPLQVYEVDPSDVPALAACHWNIFQSYHNQRVQDCAGYLTVLRENDVTGLAAIPCDGVKPNKIEWPERKAQAWIHGLADQGNLAWWDLPEEARPWSASEVKLLRDYTAWTRRSDPARRPTYEYTPNNRNAAQIAGIVPEVDVIGLSCYCEEMRMPHAWVRYKIQESGLHGIALAGKTVGPDYLHGQKIPVAIICCAKPPKTTVLPSPDQTYHDVWSAIVSGARGIGVYAYHHAMHDDPALKKNFARLNQAAAEIASPEKIGDVILWGEPNPAVSFQILAGPKKTVSFRPPHEKTNVQYPSLNLLSKIRNGIVYVIAVNSTDQTVTVRVTGLPPGSLLVTLPFENRSLSTTAGALTDSFPPWGVHIYKTTKRL